MSARPDLIGKMIIGVEWSTEAAGGRKPNSNEIDAIVFSDGSSVVFGGSRKEGVPDVWADYVSDPGSPGACDAIELLRIMVYRPHLTDQIHRRASALLNRINEARAKVAARTEGD